MKSQKNPRRVINSIAPVRICDNGAMTDTWFAKHGKVFNIAVSPYAEVQIEVSPLEDQDERILLFAENYGDNYVPKIGSETWDRHPLLEAALNSLPIPNDVAIKINVYSAAPIGGSIGSSAAVTVALLGALDCLTPGRLSRHEIAYLAQEVETKKLKQECGIQDQLCAAFGGINFIEISKYPNAAISPIQVAPGVWQELEKRLILIYLGKSHNSSNMHKEVIQRLGPDGTNDQVLDALRITAEQAKDAMYSGDFVALGQSMMNCTKAQRALHPHMVSPDANQIIDICKEHGALGWKVNGAGGYGGSITILCGTLSHNKRALIRAIEGENQLFQNIPIRLCPSGLQTWETESLI